MSAVKSLAAEIRKLASSEEFDLHGYEGSQVSDLVTAAFETPLQSTDYVRITFVVGGGKKCRQKYSPELPKELSQALAALGFQEDRGASACEQCQATYKYQHDTDKDLKFMHVFPRVEIGACHGGFPLLTNTRGKGRESIVCPSILYTAFSIPSHSWYLLLV
uniref:Uncharacterized protein n=1 Tax=Tetraselmis sp. GSL018 TaxID=582737 RepID=A0A061QZ24_9CHLO|eukprot:CAMPEP_0177610802 /NCGR_PEP_ID=MMETSP0419_2-20121207/20030_1 /TAXON_ID=582737 /ORGANISM="Tetraselmis sp., Strain GSL018" /LENGTH=161 /DNA_ID=CAMNT_0019106245 /DNA_START=87 /DNA_END=572 /DNA_ORIENTATION=+